MLHVDLNASLSRGEIYCGNRIFFLLKSIYILETTAFYFASLQGHTFPQLIYARNWLYLLSMKVKVKVSQSYLTLCNPMNYTVHGILQARILEWVAFPFSRGSSQPRDRTQVSHIAGGFFTSWVTREALYCKKKKKKMISKLVDSILLPGRSWEENRRENRDIQVRIPVENILKLGNGQELFF